MITIKLTGGLGNQMFQYATALSLAIKKGTNVTLDISEFKIYNLRNYELDKYNISSNTTSKSSIIARIVKKIKAKSFFKKRYLFEQSLEYIDNVESVGENVYLDGYFQSELYFLDIKEKLIEEFQLKNDLSSYAAQIESEITHSNYTTVSLHVRRGDYVTNSYTNSVHGVCSLSYYHSAIKRLESTFDDIHYYIFSDDIAWVKENLPLANATYIEGDNSRVPHEDIYLMSCCQHNIIANSSFSWWGGWLNTNLDKVVIAPNNWFKKNIRNNIIPSDWVKL
ncbi:alpha-1,2-fucosyltransferase [Vibrio vulnificus]|nr:alpha-1,2-fucosyltransferase [Vibrio vulnificus]EHW0637499.1 alpha-1,2-fucosyltransferase [Vibrio vulnificus]EIU7554151.1 alpha-1,2-fucosyltransferase [Vibrio vulnificus]EME0827190.1 alpha-1,2-fucosyltransferase [Vibrio vulnificus]